jgi:hypothetical protein
LCNDKLKLPVDVFQMSLQISLGGLEKVFVPFDAFGSVGGFTTDQVSNWKERRDF